jgi:hypothetical protein
MWQMCVALAFASFLVPNVTMAQTSAPTPLPIPETRPLTQAEIIRIMAGVRQAARGKIVRKTALPGVGGPVETALMGAQGRPGFLAFGSYSNPAQEFDSATLYLGIPAQTCQGKVLDGELTVNYRWSSVEKRWIFEGTSQREFAEPDTDFTDMFNADYSAGDLTDVNGLRTYRFVAPWVNKRLIIGEQPTDVFQVLWIDAATSLPEAWDLMQAGKPLDLGYTFVWNASALPHPPFPNVESLCIRQ